MSAHEPRWEDMVRYDSATHTITTLPKQRILCSCENWSSSWVARTPGGIRDATREWQYHVRKKARAAQRRRRSE